MATRIPYLDEVWNVTTGCGDDMVSPGCLNCYARRMFGRNLWKCPECKGEGELIALLGDGVDCTACDGTGYQDFAPTFHADRLDQPLHWRKPRRIGVSFMGDLFHEAITWDQIDSVLRTIAACPQHTFLLLTKRLERMQLCFTDRERDQFLVDPLPNLHLGVTVCNQAEADRNILLLLDTPAAVRWVSLEPMLGAVGLPPGFKGARLMGDGREYAWTQPTIDWVVLGGETGPGARPMQPEWALDVYRQCKAAGVPFWFKQWGDHDKQHGVHGVHFTAGDVATENTHELPVVTP